MNSGRALVLILAGGIAVVVAFALFTLKDSGPVGPSGLEESDPDREREAEDPGAISTVRVTLTGRVLARGSGQPVRRAEVSIGKITVVTGRDGRFTLEDAPGGEPTVRVEAEGAIALTKKLEVGGESKDVGDLLLSWPTVLTGLVTDVDARPVPGAAVRVLERTTYEAGNWRGPSEDQIRFGLELFDDGKPIPGLRLTTDAEGRYRVEGLTAGNYFVSARKTGHATGHEDSVEVPVSGEATADISLGKASTIAGKVLDAGDAPVDGALVMVTPWSGAQRVPYRPMERTTSTAGGAFRVDTLEEGTSYLVIVRAPDGKIGIAIQVPAPKMDLVVRVGPRFDLRGMVTDAETGEAIPGARLWTILARCESGEDGHYELVGMVNHVFFYYVWIEADGYAPAQKGLSLLERMGSDLQKDFKLTKLKPSTLTVTVRDTSGTPVAGAAVMARDWDENLKASATTNGVGEAVLEGVLSEGVQVAATKEGYSQTHLYTEPSGQRLAYASEFQWMSVPGGQAGTLDVTMIATGPVAGTVRDRAGNPLAGVSVGTSAAKLGVTDEKGAFRLDGAPVGLRTVLEFRKTGYVRKNQILEADQREGIQVEMAKGGTIAGVVVSEKGEPVGGVSILAELKDMGIQESAKSDVKGRFRIQGLEPGEYTLIARRAGFAFTRSGGLALAEAQQVEDVELTLIKGFTVSLLAVDPGGSPVNATILVHGPMDAPTPERILRQSRRQGGEALVLQLRPGRYKILASPWGKVEGAGAAEFEQVIDAAGEVRVELSATVLRLIVKAKVPAGRRLGSVQVERIEPAEPNVTLWFGVEEDGTFRSVPLPPGKYRLGFWLRPESQDDSWEYQEVEELFSPGEDVQEVDLTK
ncbi:MAG: carboxypeptidase regulatory-like domain-containing protein [Planctomycetota bacterium]